MRAATGLAAGERRGVDQRLASLNVETAATVVPHGRCLWAWRLQPLTSGLLFHSIAGTNHEIPADRRSHELSIEAVH